MPRTVRDVAHETNKRLDVAASLLGRPVPPRYVVFPSTHALGANYTVGLRTFFRAQALTGINHPSGPAGLAAAIAAHAFPTEDGGAPAPRRADSPARTSTPTGTPNHSQLRKGSSGRVSTEQAAAAATPPRPRFRTPGRTRRSSFAANGRSSSFGGGSSAANSAASPFRPHRLQLSSAALEAAGSAVGLAAALGYAPAALDPDKGGPARAVYRAAELLYSRHALGLRWSKGTLRVAKTSAEAAAAAEVAVEASAVAAKRRFTGKGKKDGDKGVGRAEIEGGAGNRDAAGRIGGAGAGASTPDLTVQDVNVLKTTAVAAVARDATVTGSTSEDVTRVDGHGQVDREEDAVDTSADAILTPAAPETGNIGDGPSAGGGGGGGAPAPAEVRAGWGGQGDPIIWVTGVDDDTSTTAAGDVSVIGGEETEKAGDRDNNNNNDSNENKPAPPPYKQLVQVPDVDAVTEVPSDATPTSDYDGGAGSPPDFKPTAPPVVLPPVPPAAPVPAAVAAGGDVQTDKGPLVEKTVAGREGRSRTRNGAASGRRKKGDALADWTWGAELSSKGKMETSTAPLPSDVRQLSR